MYTTSQLKIQVFRFVLPLAAVLVLAACGNGKGPANSQSHAGSGPVGGASMSNASDGVTFGNWGPKSMVLGRVPNAQKDGSMGMWIPVSNKSELGKYKVLFEGHVLAATGGNDALITAGVPPALLATVGPKTVAIQRVQDGKLFVVGTFNITPATSTSARTSTK